MTHQYQVYVGNLSTTVSTEKLKDLFSQVGEVLDVWINPQFKKITYGFVKFDNIISAEDACEQFNDQNIDFFQIKVRISELTKRNLQVKSKINLTKRENKELTESNLQVTSEINFYKREGILLEMPKKKGKSQGYSLKKIFNQNLRENKEIIEDFQKACLEAENIAFPHEFEIVKTAHEAPDLTMLETTVLRYFKPPREKNTVQVDFDLSKGKRLTTEQYNKFFNLKLTKPRPITKKEEKKRKPFALDYRSVCD